MSGILVPKPMLGRQLSAGRARSLVGYWPLNEGSGNIVSDLSGNGRTGSSASIVWVPGKFGSAIDMNATAAAIDVDCSLTLPNGSISVWVKYNAHAGNQGPFSSFDGATARIQCGSQADGDIFFYPNRADSGSAYILVTNPLTLGQWHYIVYTWEFSTKTGKIYVDGIEQTLAIDGLVANWANAPVITTIELGVGSTTVLNGDIANESLYNRVLSASEIAELYREPFGMFDRTPIELWVGATSVGVPPVGMAGAMTTNTGFWGY